jgi:GT2 family glycosyltransferase
MAFPTTKVQAAVIILGWNGRKFFEQFLPSVLAHTPREVPIYLADSQSTDDGTAYVRQQFPAVRILPLNANLGYAGGYNKAVPLVEAEVVVLLNQDVEVTAGWVDRVLPLFEADPRLAAVQPKLRSFAERDRFEYAGAAGGLIDRYGYPFCRGRIFEELESDRGQYDEPADIFWASGTCLFVRKRIFEELQGFDAGFFAHMEEIDLCWRIHQRGDRIAYCPQSVIYHVGGGSLPPATPLKTYLNFRNSLIMLTKNLPPAHLAQALLVRLPLDYAGVLKFLLQGKPGCAGAILKAHWHFLRGFQRWRQHWRTAAHPVAPSKMPGFYNHSIVWQYYVHRRKTVQALGCK